MTRHLSALLSTLLAGCSGAQPTPGPAPGQEPRRLVARIVHPYPHAEDAFTQGLVFHEGSLFESTGQEGSLRRLSLEQATPVWSESIPGVFPEGLASDGQRLFQLTWRDGRLFTWAGSPPSLQRTQRYTGEGWGLCYRRGQLVRSDGSATLRFHEPEGFAEVAQRQVTLQGQPVKWLNELECTEDAVYANVWVSTPLLKNSSIVQIEPETGTVVAVIDASPVVRAVPVAREDPGAVLNGIAIEPGSGRIFLTGKNWPALFEVVFEPAPTSTP
jgi:glutaminyl-peptide cyclotransferase